MAGVFTGRIVVLQEDGTPEQISIAIATTNFFDVMGGKILSGRNFNAQDGIPQSAPPDNKAANAPPPLPRTAIFSYEYFRRRYGDNTSILGRSMTIPGQPGPVIAGERKGAIPRSGE